MFFSQQNKYKLLDVANKNNNSNKLSTEQSKKYAKLLNNLLSIKRSDASIFTKLNESNIDLHKMFKNNDIEKIFKNKDFVLTLEKKIVKKRKNVEETIVDDSLFIAKWKRYIKTCEETFEQTNAWPLFIGTYFIKAKFGDKKVYAPLVLKEVELFIENNDVKLRSKNSYCVLNEKLMFVMNEFGGISVPNLNDDIENFSARELINELDQYLKKTIDFDMENNEEPFKDLKAIDVNNERTQKTNGVVLMFSNPLGGVLRSALVDIIKNDKIKNLINVNVNDVLVSEDDKVKQVVFKPMYISRVCPTDPSQEKAIIESLNKHTIIIGPPGTGKSQTIANILTNILLTNKKALFISQKRVALEVVLERMKSLQFFTLQLVEHKKHTSSEKYSFYDYLANFINLISNYSSNGSNSQTSDQINLRPLVSDEWLDYWKSKENNINNNDLDIFYDLKTSNVDINQTFINNVYNVFNGFQKISRYEEINSLMNLNERDFKVFVNKLNVKPKHKFLGIKKYDRSIHKLFDANIKLLNVIDQYKLNEHLMNKLKSYDRPTSLLELENIYNAHHSNEIKYSNEFYSNEMEVKKIVASRTKAIWEQIQKSDSSWTRKFKGRIDRRFAQPSKFISLFKKELKKLFNIYVSTPEALASFIDFKKDKFDYVIFDEASQIFLEKAIPYISIAKTVIVAGDDQQMQPSNWFGFRSDVDVDESEEENIDSLLTYAIETGMSKQNLELNYRSALAALTTFSSKEFYESNLKTLDNNNSNLTNAIEVIDVDGKWVNNVNEIEARKAIEILVKNISKYKKIILLTLNLSQLDLINIILSNEYPDIYNLVIDGKITLKNLENIQGDEADLVIVSIGYTKNAALAATYVGRNGGRNALNVAITRAKDKMIVVKSIKSSEILVKNDANKDLLTFKNWINFLELNNDQQREYLLMDEKNAIAGCQSNFEIEVIEWLKTIRFNKEMEIVSQYPIGSYKIDVAILDKNTNRYILGIEVDGFRYHSTLRQRYNDLVRQSFIEAKGYRLIRISELLWKTNKNKIREMIYKELKEN